MPLASARAARGIRIHHINIGQPDIPTPAPMLDAIRSYEPDIVPYAPSRGMPETLEAWKTYYCIHGYDLDVEQLIVTTGGSEALWFAFMAVADEGGEILMFEPTYANYFGFAASTGVRPVAISLDPANGFHLPPAAVIEESITSETRALCIANPNNPTGTVYEQQELESLLDVARRHNLYIISDETYRELVFDDAHFESIFHLARESSMQDQIIVVDSISKRFSATGMRVGCLATTNREIMDAVGRFAQARLSSPTVEQLAAVCMLVDPLPYTDWLRSLYEERRDAVFKCIQKDQRIFCQRPSGAFYVMLTLPVNDSDDFASWLLTDFEDDGETVMIAPGAGFYYTPGIGSDQARIAYVLNETDLARSVALISKSLDHYPSAIA